MGVAVGLQPHLGNLDHNLARCSRMSKIVVRYANLAEGEDITPTSCGAKDCGLGELEELGLLSRENRVAMSRQPGVHQVFRNLQKWAISVPSNLVSEAITQKSSPAMATTLPPLSE